MKRPRLSLGVKTFSEIQGRLWRVTAWTFLDSRTPRFAARPMKPYWLFNRRVSAKLNRWMSVFKYVPFHAQVLERVYKGVWHERTVSSSLMTLRIDRGDLQWGAVRGYSAEKRRRLHGPVHARRWMHLDFDWMFATAMGVYWRSRQLDCTENDTWEAGCERFVVKCCELHELPTPHP